MKTRSLLISFALVLGLGLALLWLLGGRLPVIRAQGPDGHSTYYVAPSCAGVPDPCYTTVQAAVDAADHPGDVVKIAAGVYTGVQGRPAPDGDDGPDVITQVVYITKTVTIRGGYTTAFTDPPDPDANPTTLDAQGQGRVLCITGEVSPTIEGLRITGGNAAGLGGDYDNGGGVYIDDATVTLNDCQVFSNTADWGGGLWLLCEPWVLPESTATFSNNTFSFNTADWGGGGLWLRSSGATLSDNTVASNDGGGLYIMSAATLDRNVILANDGVGLLLDGAATLINNILVDAGVKVYSSSPPKLLHTTIVGGGVEVEWGGTIAMTNTILVSNAGDGIWVESGGTARLEGTLWGSGAWANESDWGGDGDIITGTVNIWGDPAFVDPDNGDYHIGPGSAAINAGVDAGVPDDIDGDLRADGYPDIGADELPPNPDLVITKQATPDRVQPGGQLTYTISVANTGNVALHATITDTLPFSVTLGGTLVPPGGTLIPPGGTVILPDGRVAVTWTAVITAPGGLWTGAILVTVDEGSEGPLVNSVEVTTEEGAAGKAIAIVNAYKVYLPLVLR